MCKKNLQKILDYIYTSRDIRDIKLNISNQNVDIFVSATFVIDNRLKANKHITVKKFNDESVLIRFPKEKCNELLPEIKSILKKLFPVTRKKIFLELLNLIPSDVLYVSNTFENMVFHIQKNERFFEVRNTDLTYQEVYQKEDFNKNKIGRIISVLKPKKYIKLNISNLNKYIKDKTSSKVSISMSIDETTFYTQNRMILSTDDHMVAKRFVEFVFSKKERVKFLKIIGGIHHEIC